MTRRVVPVSTAATALAVALLAGCGPSAEDREAAAVARAADALREAPEATAEQRRALLADLERTPAAAAPAARARDACALAYRLLLDGTALEAKVRAALARTHTGAGAPGASVLLDLSAAEAKIEESAAAMPDCERALADLRRRRRGP